MRAHARPEPPETVVEHAERRFGRQALRERSEVADVGEQHGDVARRHVTELGGRHVVVPQRLQKLAWNEAGDGLVRSLYDGRVLLGRESCVRVAPRQNDGEAEREGHEAHRGRAQQRQVQEVARDVEQGRAAGGHHPCGEDEVVNRAVPARQGARRDAEDADDERPSHELVRRERDVEHWRGKNHARSRGGDREPEKDALDDAPVSTQELTRRQAAASGPDRDQRELNPQDEDRPRQRVSGVEELRAGRLPCACREEHERHVEGRALGTPEPPLDEEESTQRKEKRHERGELGPIVFDDAVRIGRVHEKRWTPHPRVVVWVWLA